MVDVAHHGDHRRARQAVGVLRQHFLVRERFRIIQRRDDRLVAHFLHQNHGGVLVQRLVDGDHLAHLHQRLDDLRCLDRHLVGEFGNGDGLGHMHLDDALLDGCLRGVFLAPAALVAAAPARTTAEIAAADTAGAVTTGLDFLLLGRIARPT